MSIFESLRLYAGVLILIWVEYGVGVAGTKWQGAEVQPVLILIWVEYGVGVCISYRKGIICI